MIFNPRFFAAALILFSMLLLPSCEKFQKDPVVEFVASKVTDEGIQLKAAIKEGKKNVTNVGFCYGTTTLPQADLNSSLQTNTIVSSLDGSEFSSEIPAYYFESYTGYYLRPYAKKGSEVFYGKEIYFEQIQQALVTPSCSPADNYFYPGAGVFPGGETYSSVDVSYGPLHEYNINAHSNSHSVKLEFRYKPKTGIYYSSPYTSQEDPSLVYVILNVGSMSKLAESGHPVYVNEVSKDKFEITFCEMPWKFNSSNTVYATTKMIID